MPTEPERYYWICYYIDRLRSPWFLCHGIAEFQAVGKGQMMRHYRTRKAAELRLKRIRRVWVSWRWAQLRRLLPEAPASFTSKEFFAAELKLEGLVKLNRVIQDIRRLARVSGLDPDRVIFTKGEFPNHTLHPGDLLDQLDLGGDPLFQKLASTAIVDEAVVGEVYRPRDKRRKGTFRITGVSGDHVVGDDGRKVQLKRIDRYERVT